MSLCSGHREAVSTPRSPRSSGPWTAKAVLDALSDALCRFLDHHYFAPELSHDEILTNSKAEEMYMDEDDISNPKKGGLKGGEWEEDEELFLPSHMEAEIKLAAYESLILETPQDVLEVAEVYVTPRPEAVAEPSPVAAVRSLPTTAVAEATTPKKAVKAKKAKKAKSPKAAKAAVPRALAADANASPAKAKAAAPLRKLAPARKASAKPVSVRV